MMTWTSPKAIASTWPASCKSATAGPRKRLKTSCVISAASCNQAKKTPAGIPWGAFLWLFWKGLTAAFTFHALQATAFEPQVVVHAVTRAIDPLLDEKLVIAVGIKGVTQHVAGNRFTAFAGDFCSAVTGAGDALFAAQGASLGAGCHQ